MKERIDEAAAHRVADGRSFFAIGLEHLQSNVVGGYPATLLPQTPFVIEGKVLDGQGTPVPDVFLEIWQADPTGRYPTTDIKLAPDDLPPGFARVPVDAQGNFRFTTWMPGAVSYDGDRLQAPHLLVLLFMRGLLRNLVTRVYFPGDPLLITDPVLELTPEYRRATLIARPIGIGSLHWDIVLRGALDGLPETVFFAW